MEEEEKEHINMGDFMDVIMAYKCKFCNVTCCTSQQMSTHIKNDHVVIKDGTPSLKIKNSDDLASITIKNDTPNQDEVLTVNANDQMETLETQISGPQPNVAQTPAQILNLTPTASALTNLIERHNQASLEDAEHYTLTSQASMDSNAQLNTKLLYVCGQCSVGFNSIEDCKSHMLDSHGHCENNMEIECSENISTHVSVGTQMEQKKRPGRKRKSEIKVEVVSSDSESEDQEWLPETRTSGRSRRKIRPPRALKEDYYMGKKKKKSKRQRASSDKQFTHKCHLYGCLAKFKSQENLDKHVSCHNTENEAFTCPECKKQFEAWRILRIHLQRIHSVDLDLAACDICGFKIDTMNKLRVHKEIHSDSRPYTCDICGKGFRQYSQMKNHQLVHTQYQKRDQDTTAHCKVCGRSFVNKKCLMKHEQTVHCDEKPFKCSFCSYATSRKAMLSLHMRIHTGEKPYKCDLCTYATGDHNSLRRHKMRHTGQKQYKCNFCPYSCIQAISLKCHLKTKHPGCEGAFLCEHCNFQTVSKSSFDNHLQDHRNGLVINKPKAKIKSSIITQTDIGENEYLNFSENVESMEVKMHVQTMKTGEAQVSAEDLAKLSCYEGLLTGEVSAAQLIYSALNAISQSEKSGVPQTAELLGGVQCTTLSAECEEGVTSHTITFHLPSNFQNAEQQGETILFGQPVEIIETVDESAVRFIESNINEVTGQIIDDSVVAMGIVVDDREQQTLPVEYIGTNSNEQSYIVISHGDGSNRLQVSNQDFEEPNQSFHNHNKELSEPQQGISQTLQKLIQPQQESVESHQELSTTHQEIIQTQQEVSIPNPEFCQPNQEMSISHQELSETHEELHHGLTVTENQPNANQIITIDLQQIAQVPE